MKRLSLLFILSLMCLLLVLSCGNSKLTTLKSEVKDLTGKLNSEFTKLSDITKGIYKEIEDIYPKTDFKAIDIKDMDEKAGGRYYLYQNKMYVTKFDKADINLLGAVITGKTPVTDDLKKEVKFLENNFTKPIIERMKAQPNCVRFVIGSLDSFLVTSPNTDITLLFPVGLDFAAVAMYKNAVASTEGFYWSQPAIGIGLTGIIQVHNAVFKFNNNFKYLIMTSAALPKTINSVIGASKSAVFIVHTNTTVFGATLLFRQSFSMIKALEDFDYTTQLKENPKMGEEFKLSYEKNSDEVKALGALITKDNVDKKDLTVTINKKKYNVVIGFIPDNNLFVVGLL